MNKKAMFSQPINGLSDEEIIKTREKAMAFLELNMKLLKHMEWKFYTRR